jgi:hypothetical protein
MPRGIPPRSKTKKRTSKVYAKSTAKLYVLMKRGKLAMDKCSTSGFPMPLFFSEKDVKEMTDPAGSWTLPKCYRFFLTAIDVQVYKHSEYKGLD